MNESTTGKDFNNVTANTSEALEHQIVQLAVNISAAMYEFLVLIRRFDLSEAWAAQGCLSCAQWLNFRVGLDPRTAREKLKVAHSLDALPKISEAFQKGCVSYSQVRAMARVATAENEETLLLYAAESTAAQLEKFVRYIHQADVTPQADKRYFSLHTEDDGMVVIRMRVLPEEGAVLVKAMEAVQAIPKKGESVDRIHALVEVAERSLGGGSIGTDADCSSEASAGSAGPRCISGDHYQVVLHIEEDRAHIEGVAVSQASAERMLCDASVVTMTHDGDGHVIDVGRKSRKISTPLKRALLARDKHCVYPGCEHRHVDAHHIREWQHGGETTLLNACLLCRRHHALLHEGLFRIEGDGGTLMFFDREGKALSAGGQLPGAQPLSEHPESANQIFSSPLPSPHFDYAYVTSVFLDEF